MQLVSELPLLVERRVCGVGILDLPCLDSGHNLNLTSEDMDDLWRQGIAVENGNNLSPGKLLSPKTPPYQNWKRREIEYQKESFACRYKTIYTTHMLI